MGARITMFLLQEASFVSRINTDDAQDAIDVLSCALQCPTTAFLHMAESGG
jgi:hypothetical protein